MQDFDADVVIVGAGMVGLTAALALADSSLKILVLESRELDPAAQTTAVAAQ